MPRVVHRLTAIKVSNIKAKGLYPDGGGLYLRATSTGTKSWIFRFTRGGITHDMGLGPFPSISLARARELAAEAGRQRLEGHDPIKAREAQRAAARRAEAGTATFRHCAEQFIASREPGWRNPKHAKLWRSTLNTYAYPILGELSVAAVDTTLIKRVLEPIWTNKPQTASRVRNRMEAVLDWAKVSEFRDGENPARWRGHLDHLLPASSKVRRVQHHPALPYAQVPEFMDALRSRSGIGPRALEFVILTAARTHEALLAAWGEVDLGARMWIVPAQRMKGGREHRVPLCDRAVAILKVMEEVRQNELLFPGFKQGRPLGHMSLRRVLHDLRPGITTHGFRSAFKDWASETTSFPDHLSEAALAHTSADKVRTAYLRSDLFEKRRTLMEQWAAFCGRSPANAQIVSLGRRRIG
jgi:integrase